MHFILLLLVIFPILELLVLVKVGSIIGALNTIALVILGAILGLAIIRRQGFQAMLSVKKKMVANERLAMSMMDGLFIALGGGLLVLPGFITDVIGAVFLIPFVRKITLRKLLASKCWWFQQANIYEGEFYREGGDIKGQASIHHDTARDSCHHTMKVSDKR